MSESTLKNKTSLYNKQGEYNLFNINHFSNFSLLYDPHPFCWLVAADIPDLPATALTLLEQADRHKINKFLKGY